MWNKEYSIKKVFSKTYSENKATENVFLQTGVWENPIPFVSSSFIGGAVFGKNIICDGVMSKDGSLSFNTSMKEEEASVLKDEIIRNTVLTSYDITFSDLNSIFITIAYLSEPNDPYQGDVGLWATMSVYVDGINVSKSPDRYGAGGFFSSDRDIGASVLVTGDQRGQVTRTMFYNGFYSKKSNVRVEVRNAESRYKMPVRSMVVKIYTIKESQKELSKDVLVTVIEG